MPINLHSTVGNITPSTTSFNIVCGNTGLDPDRCHCISCSINRNNKYLYEQISELRKRVEQLEKERG